jgi:hypothetical protein
MRITMDLKKTTVGYLVAMLPLLMGNFHSSNGQVEVMDGIDYRQVSNFETDYSITAMKMSGDGTRIVFATSGPAVKVYTINTDGTHLTQVYDFERTGTGPSVDISASGTKVIWCDGEGEVFIANPDGSGLLELATLLPNPDPNFADMEPIIPVPPRITADGNQVLFIHMGRDPRGSGVWRVNSDDSGLTQVFNYNEMAEDLFGTDTAEYEFNSAFTDGFDISADGTRMVLGTRIFKLAAGDMDRGDAIAVDGTDFYNIGDYAIGNQPFATYVHGDIFTLFRREFNPELGSDEINVYAVPLGTGSDVKLIGGLDIFGTSSMTQMASDGSLAIVLGANGRLPITRVDRITRSRLDLVSIDGLTIAMGGYRFSESRLPSIAWNGNKFCFLSTSIPNQIWLATINSNAIGSLPSISQIKFEPDEVAIDGSTTSTITAHVSYPGRDIHAVTFDTYQDGVFRFRVLKSDWPYSGMLLDDGTFGDESAGDGFFTNNTVRADLPETALGTYTVRIAAVDTTLTRVSVADATPFSIVASTVSIADQEALPRFMLHQNVPNPFRNSSTIWYEIPEESHVEITVHDVLGKIIARLVNEPKGPGVHSVDLHLNDTPGGVYFYSMRVGEHYFTKKVLKY